MVSLSSSNKLNVSVNEEDDGDYLDTNDNKISDFGLSESMSSLVCSYWGKIEKHINIDYAVTKWVLCVITHIRKYVFENSDVNNMKQVNNAIRQFHGISYDDMN